MAELPRPTAAQAIKALEVVAVRAGLTMPDQGVDHLTLDQLRELSRTTAHPYVRAGIDLAIAQAFPLEEAIEAAQQRARLEQLEDPAAPERVAAALRELHRIVTEGEDRYRLASAKELLKFYVPPASRGALRESKQQQARDAAVEHNARLRKAEAREVEASGEQAAVGTNGA